MSAVLRGWLRSGEVGSGEVTTKIHFCVSRVSRGADWLELPFSSRPAAAAERKRERQRESTGRAGLAAIDGAGLCPRFAVNNTATYRDRNTFVSTTSGFTDADTRSCSAAQDSRRHSAIRSHLRYARRGRDQLDRKTSQAQ